MRTLINSRVGVKVEPNGSGLEIEGKEYHEAPFDGRWSEISAFIDDGSGPAQLTYEGYRDTGFYLRFFRHNQDDNIFMRFQLPPQWDPTTGVHPHIHLIPMSSGSGVVKLNYMYAWCAVNSGTLPAAVGWSSGSLSASYTPADQYMQNVIVLEELTPPGPIDNLMLVFKVERPGQTDAVDTYNTSKDHGTAAANVAALFFDLHYRINKGGSVTQGPDS